MWDMRIISGTLRSTPLPWPSVLSNIEPPTAHRPDLCEQSMTRLGCSTLLLNSKAREQMTAEC